MKPNESTMEPRQQRGLTIAAICKITQKDGVWVVPSQSGKGKYTVRLGDETEYTRCNCPDYETNACKCKHICAVEFVVQREHRPDGTTSVTETLTSTKRKTYEQNWPAYNAAQTNEKHQFQLLLRDLCQNIQNPAQTKGRPTLPLSDAIFAVTFKIFSTVSGRRFMCDLTDAQARGYVAKVPHFN